MAIFRKYGVIGWRRHLPLPGKPDFTFSRQRVVVFVDGCFWHGCGKHLRLPKNNHEYWQQKISRNINRDKITKRTLSRGGWKVLRVWEHELKNEPILMRKIMRVLGSQGNHGQAA